MPNTKRSQNKKKQSEFLTSEERNLRFNSGRVRGAVMSELARLAFNKAKAMREAPSPAVMWLISRIRSAPWAPEPNDKELMAFCEWVPIIRNSFYLYAVFLKEEAHDTERIAFWLERKGYKVFYVGAHNEAELKETLGKIDTHRRNFKHIGSQKLFAK